MKQITARVPEYVFDEVESLVGYGKPYETKRHLLDKAIQMLLASHYSIGLDSENKVETKTLGEIIDDVKEKKSTKSFSERFNEKN